MVSNRKSIRAIKRALKELEAQDNGQEKINL